MEAKICDLCLQETGKIIIIGHNWHSWHWSHSSARTIHLCENHWNNIQLRYTLKGQTYEEYAKMVRDIDEKYGNLGS